jgi:nicotinate-nucleotide adenylyltransferase
VLATASNTYFSVSRIEIDRGGPTYTLDTLRELKAFYQDSAELFFITGADAVIEILSWKDPEAVLAEACFIAATRPDYDLSQVDSGLFRDRVMVMEIPHLNISSTDIRKRIAEGRSVRYLIPPEVGQLIEQRGLYLAGNDAGL